MGRPGDGCLVSAPRATKLIPVPLKISWMRGEVQVLCINLNDCFFSRFESGANGATSEARTTFGDEICSA